MTELLSPPRPPLMGMNLELKRAGRSFHIQTEDMGLPRGELVTQLFMNGSIVETLTIQYYNSEDLPPKRPPSETELRHQMRDQHLSLVRAVQGGRYDQASSSHTRAPDKAPLPLPSKVLSSPKMTTKVPVETISRQDQGDAHLHLSVVHAHRAHRELASVQRGIKHLGRQLHLEELTFTPQAPYPDFTALSLNLDIMAQTASTSHKVRNSTTAADTANTANAKVTIEPES